MRSWLTAGMPHMTASTARRSIVRRANSSAEKVCEVACCANPTRANAATSALNIAPSCATSRFSRPALNRLQGYAIALRRKPPALSKANLARLRGMPVTVIRIASLTVVASQSEHLLSLLCRAAHCLRHDTRRPADELHVGRFEIDHQVLVALARADHACGSEHVEHKLLRRARLEAGRAGQNLRPDDRQDRNVGHARDAGVLVAGQSDRRFAQSFGISQAADHIRSTTADCDADHNVLAHET